MKKCSKCKKRLHILSFYRDSNRRDGYKNQCKSCHNLTAHKARRYNKEQFLQGVYRHMSSRVNGTHYNKKSSAEGKSILDRRLFLTWSLSNKKFHSLFDKYVESEFVFALSPSVDRIDPRKGYVLSNIQWLTVSENGKKGMLHDKLLLSLKE